MYQNIGNSTGGTFQWTVPTDLPNRSDYAIQIRRGRDNNISGQFESSGGPALVVTIKTLYIEPTGRATFATYAAPSFATRTGATQPAQFTGGDSPNTDTRHSTAVKAGIGVGASIGGLLLLGGTFLLGKMATRRGKRENSASDEDFDGKPELEGLGKSSLITVREHELESPTASEMESVDSKHELDAGEKTELEGTGKCEVDGKTTVRYELP